MAATKIRVVFKSGHAETFSSKDFTVKRNLMNEVTELSWSNDIQPRIMHINLAEIAAVLEVKS